MVFFISGLILSQDARWPNGFYTAFTLPRRRDGLHLATKGVRVKTIVSILLLVVAEVSSALAQQPSVYDDRPKITVTGEAVVNVKPDKIVIRFGIETSDADIGIAKKKNNEILKKAVAAIKERGVPEKEIQTDYLSIEPRWKDNYNQGNFLGYFVRNNLAVNLTETEKVEQLVTQVLQAGVNYIHGIDFQTTEFKKYREQARELALAAAREKAEKMASVLGETIGAPIQINENPGGSPWGYYSSWSGWGYGRSQGMMQNVVQNVGGDSGEISDTIALGKISIRASVSVTFQLKNH
jgi:uncharacterized protein YggE